MMKYDTPDAIWEGLNTCPVHPMGTELLPAGTPGGWDTCEGCVAEQAGRSAIIDQMQADAAKRMSGIVQQGGPQMPPWTMLEARLDTLCDTLFTDPRNRTLYEGEVGRRIMNVIKDIQEQVKQPTLHVAKNLDGVRDIRGGRRG